MQADRIAWRRSNRKPRESGAFLGPVRRLVISHTIVIAMPPIGAPGDASLTAQPPAVVIGVIVGPPIPHPHAIDEYPMATMEAIKVVVALREAAVLEPFAAVVAFHESASATVFLPRTASKELAHCKLSFKNDLNFDARAREFCAKPTIEYPPPA